MKKTFFRVCWELLNHHHESEEGQMESSTPTFDVNLNPSGFVVDLDSLYAHLARLQDRRHARGLRYALVTILGYIVLAKLAGEDRTMHTCPRVQLRYVTLSSPNWRAKIACLAFRSGHAIAKNPWRRRCTWTNLARHV